MQADAGIGGAGPAGDKTDAGATAQLALRFGHEGRSALLPAGNEADVLAVFVKAVEHSQVAFAGNAKTSVDTLGDQCFDQNMTGGT